MKSVSPKWSRAQADFIEGLRQAGASSSSSAASIEPSMMLTEEELRPLIDAGIVLEAGRSRYYLRQMTREQNLLLAMAAARRTGGGQPARGRRFLMAMIFWVILIAIPIIMIRLMSP